MIDLIEMFEKLKNDFLEKITETDTFDFLEENNTESFDFLEKEASNNSEIVSKNKSSDVFLRLKKESIEKLFILHQEDLIKAVEFIFQTHPREQIGGISIETSEEKESLFICISSKRGKAQCALIPIKKKINFEELISHNTEGKKYKLNYYNPFINFLFFFQSQIFSGIVEKLDKTIKNLEQKSINSIVPVNLFNVVLTDKPAVLEKLKDKIQAIEKALIVTTDEAKLRQLKKQKKLADDVFIRAKINFPDDFYFDVYKHYAIFGGIALLSQNKFRSTPFSATSALEALKFSIINKKEITEIRKAFAELTVDKFPCYYIREDKDRAGEFIFCNADAPIFMICEKGRINLNVDIRDDSIIRKELYLSLANPALLEDLQHFYVVINSNLLAELRRYKQVKEEDLYFVEHLLREHHFKQKTETTLPRLCKIMKKEEWLQDGLIKNRDHRRRIKDKVVDLLEFAKQKKVNLVRKYEIYGEDVHVYFQEIKLRI